MTTFQGDDAPYIECLAEHWGEVCNTKEIASAQADSLMSTIRMAWSPDLNCQGHFKGTGCCLSALLVAKRYDEILELLKIAPFDWWLEQKYGVLALAGQGRLNEAYRRFGILANQRGTYLATFRILKMKYSELDPQLILSDMVGSTPGR